MIEIQFAQNEFDGSWTTGYAFNNKKEYFHDETFDGLVNQVEKRFDDIFDHAFTYRIIVERFKPT